MRYTFGSTSLRRLLLQTKTPIPVHGPPTSTLASPRLTLIQRYRIAGSSILAAAAIAVLVMAVPQLAMLVLPKQQVLELAYHAPVPAIELPQAWQDLPPDYGFDQVRCDWRDGPPQPQADRVWIRCTGHMRSGIAILGPPPVFASAEWRLSQSSSRATLAGDGSLALIFALGPLLATLGLLYALGRQRSWRADLAQATTAMRRPWRALAPLTAAVSVMALATALGWTEVDPMQAESIGKTFREPALLLAMLLAPFWEELLLRGWLWQKLRPTLPWWLTAFLVTELFVALHIANPQMLLMPGVYIATLTASGLALAWLRERHGSVSLCILAHLTQNGAVAAALVFGTG